jgi:hypothetical protein
MWKLIYGEVMQRMAGMDSNNRLKPPKHHRVQQQHEDGSTHHEDGSSHHRPNDRMDGDRVPIIEDRSALSSSSTSSSASCFGQLQGPLLGSDYRWSDCDDEADDSDVMRMRMVTRKMMMMIDICGMR